MESQPQLLGPLWPLLSLSAPARCACPLSPTPGTKMSPVLSPLCLARAVLPAEMTFPILFTWKLLLLHITAGDSSPGLQDGVNHALYSSLRVQVSVFAVRLGALFRAVQSLFVILDAVLSIR